MIVLICRCCVFEKKCLSLYWIWYNICNLQKLHKMNERERIELIMKSYGLSPSQFADKTGIQRASVSHILGGRNKASLEVMLKIYDAFPGLDMKWLMTGVGDEPGASVSPASSSAMGAGMLFAESDGGNTVQNHIPEERIVRQPEPEAARKSEASPTPRERRVKKVPARAASAVQGEMPVRRIREIRVYYTDGTYEILMPER